MGRIFAFSLVWLGMLGLGLALSGSSCGPKKVTLEYDVEGASGAATASVTYASPTQSNASAISQALPWSASFPATVTEGPYMGTYTYLYAQNDSSGGSVTVTIKEDGGIFRQAVTVGGYPAAVSVGGTF